MQQPTPSPYGLVADRLALARGDRLVVSDVSFELRRGEALVLVGRNGVGKTTLLRAIAGFVSPRAGAICLDAGDPEAPIGERCHFLGHAEAVKGKLTVLENVTFWARFLARSSQPHDRDRLMTAIERVGLGDLAYMPAAYLSAGQKRRIGLARLLVAERPLWLLDEPLVSLDAEGARTLTALIDGHLARQGLAIISTHLPMAIGAQKTLDLEPFASAHRVDAA